MKIPFDIDKTVFLLDGSSFLYRAFYSLAPLTTTKGQQVQVVYGFCRMIKKLIKQFSPHYWAIIWDPKRDVPSARFELYSDYKATRQASPSELNAQRDLVKEFASLIGLKQVERPGVEADDVLYSLAHDLSKAGYNSILVTSDKDMRQCVDASTVIFDPFKEEFLDVPAVELRYELPLGKLVFYFALIGDSSDNIPGVRGIGPKTAVELVKQFNSLEDLYANLDKVQKQRTRELLTASREDAFLSYKLFKLYYYSFDVTLQDCAFNADNWFDAREFFQTLNFTSFLKEFPQQQVIGNTTEHVPQSTVNATFHAVTTKDELNELCDLIRMRKEVAIDTETDGLWITSTSLVGISVCVEKGKAYYIPLRHKAIENQLSIESVISALNPLFSDSSIKKYLHNTKFDKHVLELAGVKLRGITFDTMIAGYLVAKDGERASLKWLSEVYLNERMLTYEEVVTKNKFKDFSEVPLELATSYAGADAHQTLALVGILADQLQRDNQVQLFYDIEMPLLNVLHEMEEEGIDIDLSTLNDLACRVNVLLKEIEAQIHQLLPEGWSDLNLNSPRQLGELLFNVLMLPPLKKTSGKTGYSTDASVLVELAKIHPVPALILKYRELFKVKSTYIDALKDCVNPETGRIHTSFSQTSTATGRLSSLDPNLQNIPTSTLVGSLGIRAAFKAPSGYCYISADYSQIELRVLAYLSQDEKLKQAFLDGRDIHAETAMGLFDKARDEINPEERSLAKRINFSILYGLSPYGLSKDLGIPFKDARRYIEKYFAQYPGVVAWMEKVVEDAKQHGYVQTLWGRRRYVPGIYEKNRNLYDLARRVAINTVVQGTATGDLMKIGMLELDKAFKEQNLDSKMILQIHDELLITSPLANVERTQEITQQILQNIVDWNVPLVVTIRRGQDWQEVTK
jgi:DNA polymerase-1